MGDWKQSPFYLIGGIMGLFKKITEKATDALKGVGKSAENVVSGVSHLAQGDLEGFGKLQRGVVGLAGFAGGPVAGVVTNKLADQIGQGVAGLTDSVVQGATGQSTYYRATEKAKDQATADQANAIAIANQQADAARKASLYSLRKKLVPTIGVGSAGGSVDVNQSSIKLG